MGSLFIPYHAEGSTAHAAQAIRRWGLGGEGEVFFSLGPTGRVSSVAAAGGRCWGWRSAEMVGKDLLGFIAAGDRPAIRQALETVQGGQEVLGRKASFLAKDGRAVPLVFRFAPGEQDEVVLGFARERIPRKAEDSRAAPEMAQLIGRALDPHALVAVTDGAGRILHANPLFCARAKFPEAELLGQDTRILNSGHHSKAFFQDLWNTIQAGATWRGEIRNRARDGSVFWIDSSIFPLLDASGRPGHYLAIGLDITERKEGGA
jgi:PAS domain S-box-containing protein